jgi:hypothetical protein
MIEKPTLSNTIITDLGRNNLKIEIPTKKNQIIIISISVWLSFWVLIMGILTATIGFSQTLLFPVALLLFWFIMLLAIGIIPLIILLWYIKGKEQIIIRNKTMEIGKSIFKFKKSKKYDLESVLNIDILPQSAFSYGLFQLYNSFFGGTIKFNYGIKTIKFGASLGETEAKNLIEKLKTNPNFEEKNFV